MPPISFIWGPRRKINDTQADPSNRDSNKGVVRIDYEPYAALMELMRPLNREVYPLTRFFDAAR